MANTPAIPLRFRSDGTFRVLQVADVQEGPEVPADVIRLLRAAIAEARPDLVVFTGDQVRGYDPAWAGSFLRRRGERLGENVRSVTRFEAWWHKVPPFEPEPGLSDEEDQEARRADARDKFLRSAEAFLAPVIEAGIPFAVTYGNHDFQIGLLNSEQDALYRQFPGCLNPVAASSAFALEAGTFALPVLGHEGTDVSLGIALVDSGDYADKPPVGMDSEDEADVFAAASSTVQAPKLNLDDSHAYGTPSRDAVAWLATLPEELARAGMSAEGQAQPVPTMVFQHIAPPEFYELLREVPAFTPYAVEGKGNHAGRTYVLDSSRAQGVLGESFGSPLHNVGEIQVMEDNGSYLGIYVGHDHKNAFVGRAHGMDFGFTPTCGLTSYGPKMAARGVRLLEFYEERPCAYTTRLLTWGELVDGLSSDPVRVFVEDHCISNGATLRNELRRPGVFLSLGTIGLLAGRFLWRATRSFLARKK